MKHISLLYALLLLSPFCASGAEETAEVGHHWDGSKAIPYHHVPIADETGRFVDPDVTFPKPMSTRQTCGVCHDYDMISKGTHFNSTNPEAKSGRPFEPWFYVDKATGTQLPVSYRAQAGTWDPSDVGLTSWTFTMNFGRHMPGGDVADPEDIHDPNGRWALGGGLEINCMACHNGSYKQDMAEWTKQIMRQNLKWAASASAGLAEVSGMVSRLSSSFDMDRGFNPDDSQYAVPPTMSYDKTMFDSRDFAYLHIEHRPLDQRCLYCHSFQETDKEKSATDDDVHTYAGMNCVDCHRNGLDHDITRGYNNEGEFTGDINKKGLSCEGCHEGVRDPESLAVMGGRMGAPVPEHAGVPEIHFSKLTCTACHGAAWPTKDLTRVRTARANRLGISGKAIWMTDEPYIMEPVFKVNDEGKIGPYRVMWPSFWAKMEGETAKPLSAEEVITSTGLMLQSDLRIGRALAAFDKVQKANGEGRTPVFVVGDKVFRANVDQGLEVSDNTTTFTSTFPTWAIEKDGVIESMLPEMDVVKLFTDETLGDYLVNHFKALEGELPDEGQPVFTSGTTAFLLNSDYSILTVDIEPVAFPNWGWLKGEAVEPFFDDLTTETIVATGGKEQKLTEGLVALVLAKLAETTGPDDSGTTPTFAFVSSGKLFQLDSDKKLVAVDNRAAEPVSWPVAHNVRGAGQAMGARRCEDCHANDSPFYFASIKAMGPLQTDKGAVTVMKDFMGEGVKAYANVSTVFTWFIIVTMTLLILHIIADFARRTFLKPKTSE